jgi:hypothetical protein
MMPMSRVRQGQRLESWESTIPPEVTDNWEGSPELTKMKEFTHASRASSGWILWQDKA